MSHNQLPSLPEGYEYLSELGRGSQGCVWLICNNNTGGRQEACKIVTSISPKELGRFEREIQLLATLNHPNVTTIYYANQKDKYFIMEYLPGGTLCNYCQKKVLTFGQRMHLFLSISRGLSFAHKKGLIHRDLKPENIVMTDDGIPKITDFGIARSTNSGSESETINTTSGTPSYMAPELWSQYPPSTASDIWSLGVILYELLTGKCPFVGTIQEICYTVREKEIKPPKIVASLCESGAAMSDICMKMLTKDYQKRYQKCDDLINDIEKVMYQTKNISSTMSIDFSKEISFKEEDDDDLLVNQTQIKTVVHQTKITEIPKAQVPKQQTVAQSTQSRRQISQVASAQASQTPQTPTLNNKPDQKHIKLANKIQNLDFEDEEKPEQNEVKIEDEKDDENKKQNLVKKYKYLLLATSILILFITMIFLAPPSLSTLKEQLLSRDLEEQQSAFLALCERGQKSVEYLIYGLNSRQIKMRKDILAHIRKYPEDANFYLTEVVIDTSPEFNHQAKIYAIKGLAEGINDSSVESTLNEVISGFATPDDMKQEAIKSLVKINKKYKKKYHFLDGFWYRSKDLKKRGYVRTEKGWELLSKLFKPINKEMKNAEDSYGQLKEQISDVVDAFEKNNNPKMDIFFKIWKKTFKSYAMFSTKLYALVSTLELDDDKEGKSYETLKIQIDLLFNDISEFSDSLISLDKTPIAISVLQKKLNYLMKVSEWDWPKKHTEYYTKKVADLEKKHASLLDESTIFVYFSYQFYKQDKDDSLVDMIKSHIKNAVVKGDLYPRFSKHNPKKDNAKHWIDCQYRETDIGSYHGNKDKKRNHIRKIRALCNFRYWVKGNKIHNWQQVTSSSIYLELPKKRRKDTSYNEQDALCEIARVDFSEELLRWVPKKFNKKKNKFSDTKLGQVKGSTIYDQNAFDVVYKKNKKKLKGLIVKEKRKYILLSLSKISRGKVSLVKVKIRKKDILKIVRISDEVRARRLKDIKNTLKQDGSDRIQINSILLETVPWEFSKGRNKKSGFLYNGKFFELYCNTPEDFTKEIAFRTEQIFRAYQKYFPVVRNQNNKIKMYVFNSTKEYQKAIGSAFSNPAFYSPTHNHIMAGCDLASYQREVKKANKNNAKIKKQLLDEEKNIDKLRKKIKKQKKGLQKKLDERLAKGRISSAQHAVAYRKLRDQENKINSEINKHLAERKKLKRIIRLYSYQNKKLIPKYIDSMVSMMYHEAFHAFLKNFLFTEEQTINVPRWLNEGLAQYFENSFIAGNRLIIGKIEDDRVSVLKRFIKKNGTVHIRDLLVAGYKDFIVTSKDNLENSNLHYIQSWAVVHYISTLFDMKKGDVFGGYIQDIWQGKDQIKAFENLVNKPIDEFEKDWLAFYKK